MLGYVVRLLGVVSMICQFVHIFTCFKVSTTVYIDEY